MADVGNPARAPRGFRLAADPRPYWSAADGHAGSSPTVLEKALIDLVGIGFTGDR